MNAAAHALFRAVLREAPVIGAAIAEGPGRIVVELPRTGATVAAGARSPVVWPAVILDGPVRGASGVALTAEQLAMLVAKELSAFSGMVNDEFVPQVRDSAAALAALVNARAATEPPTDQFLAAEQDLLTGHPCHPAPKARQGDPVSWLPFSPEARASFRLRQLAIATEYVAEDFLDNADKSFEMLGPSAPAGFVPLPAHPWELRLIADDPLLNQLRTSGALIDLGPGELCYPTASVRTCYVDNADLFVKFSLHVRITNCLRKNAWYELQNALTLSRLLRELRLPNARILLEPAFRSVRDDGGRPHEGLGVLLREGVRPHVPPGGALRVAGAMQPWLPSDPERALAWWRRYVRLLLEPVVSLYEVHGVALEPHLQNVLVATGSDDLPAWLVFRDMEGTKLLPSAGAPATATYQPEQAINRLVYCTLVNNAAEVAGWLAAAHPVLAHQMWPEVATCVDELIGQWGRTELLRTMRWRQWPAKSNLSVRWQRDADRDAGYVPVSNPLPGCDHR